MINNNRPLLFKDYPIEQKGLWVFGYGSLMWRPGFDYHEKCPATLQGYHRDFCIYSHHHRGTVDNPGLVLGLDQGGECVGVAFNVSPENSTDVIAYLDERELIGYAYIPKLLEITLDNGPGVPNETVTAYTFVADFNHPYYAGELEFSLMAELIMSAEGVAGLNRDYLINTVRHLEDTGNLDEKLHKLLKTIEIKTGSIDMGSGI